MSEEWNPRYVQYARVHGRSPEEMLEYDTGRFPGGKMCGYINWINARWNEYTSREKVERPVVSPGHHSAFDQWLSELPEASERSTAPSLAGSTDCDCLELEKKEKARCR